MRVEIKHLMQDMEAGTLSLETAWDLQAVLRDNIVGKPLTDERLLYESAVRPLSDYIVKKTAERDYKTPEQRQTEAKADITEAEEKVLAGGDERLKEIVYRTRHDRFVEEEGITEDDERFMFNLENYEAK